MRSIAIINQKGGVGKTTTAVNVAAAMVRRGKRVLLIDLDPQGHASLHVGVEVGPDDKTIYDVLTRGAALAEVARFVDERLAVAPSHIDLAAAEVELAQLPERERALQSAVSHYREHFDVMLIDCGPSLGLLTINALTAVDEVIIPLQPHFLALQGLGRLLETVGMVRDQLQPALRVSGIVFCMAESATRLAQEVQADVEGFIAASDPASAWHGARVFKRRIRRNIKLAESPSFGQTVFQYAPSSHGSDDYSELAAEILSLQSASRPIAVDAAPISASAPAETSATAAGN